MQTKNNTMSMMKRQNLPKASRDKAKSYAAILCGILSIVLFVLLYAFVYPSLSVLDFSKTADTLEIVESESNTQPAIPYYICGDPKAPHVVLLHGARFTKAEWKQSGIMNMLCSRGLSVSALNLSVMAKHSQLLDVIESLAAEKKLSLPVVSVVTPSASGGTIVDGLVNGQSVAMKKVIKSWIPVASPASLKYEASKLAGAKGWPMLAVYGDRDPIGEKTSQVWKDVADAKVVELKGGHPVYLESPAEFVETVHRFLKDASLLS